MKYLSVIFKDYQNKTLTSICEYDSKTTQSKYISIPFHIACTIIDSTTEKKIDNTCCVFRLLTKSDPYFQD